VRAGVAVTDGHFGQRSRYVELGDRSAQARMRTACAAANERTPAKMVFRDPGSSLRRQHLALEFLEFRRGEALRVTSVCLRS